MSIFKYFGSFLVLIIFLAGCGEDSNSKAQAPISASVPVDAKNRVAASPQEPQYEASLAEGVNFKKPGYPSFLSEVTGMSVHEDWGRWTGGPVAKFRFKQPLPGKFKLLISAGAIGPNYNEPIIVRAGNVERNFIVRNSSAFDVFTLNFEGVATDTIEIVPVKPVRPMDINPQSKDVRTLGVALVYLKIQ